MHQIQRGVILHCPQYLAMRAWIREQVTRAGTCLAGARRTRSMGPSSVLERAMLLRSAAISSERSSPAASPKRSSAANTTSPGPLSPAQAKYPIRWGLLILALFIQGLMMSAKPQALRAGWTNIVHSAGKHWFHQPWQPPVPGARAALLRTLTPRAGTVVLGVLTDGSGVGHSRLERQVAWAACSQLTP